MIKSSRILLTKFQVGAPGLNPSIVFTEIIDEFPKEHPRNYFGTFKSWTKPEIEEAVFNVILDNTSAPDENVEFIELSL